MRIILACSSLFVQAIERIMFCIRTDFPLPVIPAISVCGEFSVGETNSSSLSSSLTATSSLWFPLLPSGDHRFQTSSVCSTWRDGRAIDRATTPGSPRAEIRSRPCVVRNSDRRFCTCSTVIFAAPCRRMMAAFGVSRGSPTNLEFN